MQPIASSLLTHWISVFIGKLYYWYSLHSHYIRRIKTVNSLSSTQCLIESFVEHLYSLELKKCGRTGALDTRAREPRISILRNLLVAAYRSSGKFYALSELSVCLCRSKQIWKHPLSLVSTHRHQNIVDILVGWVTEFYTNLHLVDRLPWHYCSYLGASNSSVTLY